MSMPFQWPAAYVAAIQPPAEPPERPLWFVFRDCELLVAAAPAAVALPHCNHPKNLGMMLERTLYLGVLGGQHCFSAEAAAEAAAPQGWAWQGLRAGGLSTALAGGDGAGAARKGVAPRALAPVPAGDVQRARRIRRTRRDLGTVFGARDS